MENGGGGASLGRSYLAQFSPDPYDEFRAHEVSAGLRVQPLALEETRDRSYSPGRGGPESLVIPCKRGGEGGRPRFRGPADFLPPTLGRTEDVVRAV